MKYLLIIFCFIASSAKAQNPPQAFLNYYTYSNDAIGYNHSVLKIDTFNGRLFSIGYSQAAFNEIGNNYIKTHEAKNKNSAIYNLFPLSNNEQFVVASDCVYKLKNGAITGSSPINNNFTSSISINNKQLLLYHYQTGTVSTFDGLKIDTFIKLSNPLLSAQSNINNTQIAILTAIKNNTYLNIYNVAKNEWLPIKKLPLPSTNFYLQIFIDSNNFLIQSSDLKENYICFNGIFSISKERFNYASSNATFLNPFTYPFTIKKNSAHSTVFEVSNNFILKKHSTINTLINPSLSFDKATNSAYLSTANKPIRAFNHIIKYPTVFNGKHTNACFSLFQQADGGIVAGSYQSAAVIIKNEKVQQLPVNFMVMNGGLHYQGKNYFIGEGVLGLHAVSKTNNLQKINGNGTGYYLYLNKQQNKVYFGKHLVQGLYITDTKRLHSGQPNWHIVDTSKGLQQMNILTITEDTMGRIWCGHPRVGMAIYNPTTDKAISYNKEKNESAFGAMSSLTDKWGTVWLGSKEKGLWYYNNYNKEPSPANCTNINHPLLNDNTKTIMSMCTYYGKQNYLVMGCYDKVCLLNLDSFYHGGKILVSYLNPQEAAFSSFTEQNTMLCSKLDSSIWFSTSDMIYNWDMNTWLALKTFPVTPNIKINFQNSDSSFLENKCFSLSPTQNTLNLNLWFQSRDNMPRYMNLALVKKGDSIVWDNPNLETNYTFNNLRSGNYTIYVRIFQSDGTITIHQFPIKIKKFLYQQWWFWLGLMLLALSIMGYIFNLKRRQAVQAKQLSQLNVVTLSNQFRPHFILNALNTIGADLHDKPSATAVISRLGESIDLIFNHAQQQRIHHSLTTEWMLVKNVIAIHQLMYIKNLQVTYPPDAFLNQYATTKLPLGILQIIVENSLLHGLRNKETGPYHLNIDATADANNIYFTIADNGIGRKQAETISNFKKHGTGNKNIADILQILNQQNQQKITIAFIDDWLPNETDKGTKVNITIPLQFKYQ